MKEPKAIIWLLTSRCNLACCHCYTTRFPRTGELDGEQALNVLAEAARAGVRHIGLTGEEVFLRQDVIDLVRLASDFGMSTSVVTNGSLLSDETLKTLA